MPQKTAQSTKRQIILTLPEPILQKLESDKKRFAYSSVQERITEILRNKYFRELTRTARGRPKKIDETRVLTRQGKIFTKKGVPIEI